MITERIRFRGTVQGVGFRPTVARIARAEGLCGWVCNDGGGVLVALGGAPDAREAFLASLLRQLPPLARVDQIERTPSEEVLSDGFVIVRSRATRARTAIPPDAVVCGACTAEVRDPSSRRYRYPFTTCTHCGPRFSIVQALPFDRSNTTMRDFPLCPDCRREHEDEADRRYHAQPVACGRCGPTARLVRTDGAPGGPAALSMLDDVDAARALLQRGEIVAVKGLGGYQLCCDATDEAAVARLRQRKRRPHKPLALLAHDLDQIRRLCTISATEEAALCSPANPIVLLSADGAEQVAAGVAPGQATLGIMLPSTPLHQLLTRHLDHPIVCTSGNLTEEPQCTDDDDALQRLGGIADWALVHDRPIANRVDDSVVRVLDGAVRALRRARGYAPAPLSLHPSFAGAVPLTALGGHLKATFCLLRGGQAVLSPHLGDLDEPRTVADYGHILRTLTALLEHAPERLVVDAHPGYRTRQLAEQLGELPIDVIAHHHAHAAACLAEHQLPIDTPPVLALVLDGLGMGSDGTLWGGEWLAADFHGVQRLASLPAVPLIGGDRAAREPWRSALAHLVCALGWDTLEACSGIEAVAGLLSRRSPVLELALERAPAASSAGRLFDAVAALLGLCTEAITFEAQAAMALEALVDPRALAGGGYAIELEASGEVPRLSLAPMWHAILDDLRSDVPPPVIAARFHEGLARALADTATALRVDRPALTQAVLSGGVWQNAVLLRRTLHHLRAGGWRVLIHRDVPPNDGCVALGQAAIAAARSLDPQE